MIIYYFFVINHQEEINKLKNEINEKVKLKNEIKEKIKKVEKNNDIKDKENNTYF